MLIILVVLFLIGFALIRYQNWEGEFESRVEGRTYHYIAEDEVTGYERLKEELVQDVSAENIELTPYEFLILLDESFEKGSELDVVEGYVESGEGEWKVYLKYQRLWYWFEVSSDEDTAEVYVSEFNLGPYNIGRLQGNKRLDKVNTSVRDAIIDANSSGFLSKTLEDIQFNEDNVVLEFEKP